MVRETWKRMMMRMKCCVSAALPCDGWMPAPASDFGSGFSSSCRELDSDSSAFDPLIGFDSSCLAQDYGVCPGFWIGSNSIWSDVAGACFVFYHSIWSEIFAFGTGPARP